MSKCNCECHKEEWTPQVGDVVEVIRKGHEETNKLFSIERINNVAIYLDGGSYWIFKESLKLIIPAKTAFAIAGSVRKWLDIVYKGGEEDGGRNCPLCLLFDSKDCAGCPIAQIAGKLACGNTPYVKWGEHQKIAHGGLSKVYCAECAKLALDFANWIGALLPETTLNLIKKEYEEFMEKDISECETCRHASGIIACSRSGGLKRSSECHESWQPKDTHCPTCKQPLPIKQEYCCNPFEYIVTQPGHDIRFQYRGKKWFINNNSYAPLRFCPFCGKTPIPPVKEGK